MLERTRNFRNSICLSHVKQHVQFVEFGGWRKSWIGKWIDTRFTSRKAHLRDRVAAKCICQMQFRHHRRDETEFLRFLILKAFPALQVQGGKSSFPAVRATSFGCVIRNPSGWGCPRRDPYLIREPRDPRDVAIRAGSRIE